VFERFNDQARRMVVHAAQEARALGHDYLGTEHLLLSSFDDSGAATVLRSFGLTYEAAHTEVFTIVGDVPGGAPAAHLPFSRAARDALAGALKESLELGQNHVGSEHILLGVLREDDCIAVEALRNLGVEPKRLRRSLIELLKNPDRVSPATDVPPDPEPGPRARVAQRARLEARLRGHRTAGPAHLLLGLLGERSCQAAQLLRGSGVTLNDARNAIENTLGSADLLSPPNVPLDDRSRRLLFRDHIPAQPDPTAGVLLALLDDAENDATAVLDHLDIDRTDLRDRVVRSLPATD
jgi:ATP-dependent Clp protease ATP-binding subunit ClpA